MSYSSAYAPNHHPAPGTTDLPRIVIWQIAPGPRDPGTVAPDPPPAAATRHAEPLNTSECMLVIDSIARTSRPIVVLTGEKILEKYGRLEDILEYGNALGLKMIVELTPAEITDDLLAHFSRFGQRIFRVKISQEIRDNVENRIESAPFYDELEGCLDRLTKAGYETHLVYTATGPDIRILALVHDYALRRSARGLYCHLRFDLGNDGTPAESRDVDEFIRRFATMKEYSPAPMIISPQCVRFVHTSYAAAGGSRGAWEYTCLAGRSFAFIDETGRVRLCGGNTDRGMSLRDTGYDFRKIWSHAPAFSGSRITCGGCVHGDHSIHPTDPAPDVRTAGLSA